MKHAYLSVFNISPPFMGEGAAVGETSLSLTDAGGGFLSWKWRVESGELIKPSPITPHFQISKQNY